jgi:hypothetical protein
MTNIVGRLKKAETTISDIGCDDQAYIDAFISYYRGDEGKALAVLPEYKGSHGKFAAILINAKSRYENETGHKVPKEIWDNAKIKSTDEAIGKG